MRNWWRKLTCLIEGHDWNFDWIDCARCGVKGPGFQRWQSPTVPWEPRPERAYDTRTRRVTEDGREEVWTGNTWIET